ncbi:polyhydroxyalkanoic acid system family protein [Parvularcula sp. IMCC14364]|uniref:polyhydroxyalkanoic acid system family protein n=1 Tax=Parvularcula sp. IMCC14364 TaxID=3067902 RepID=UPI0027428561|nr:polyhydroxyalkanoic acid system family protein [Parvularcula sp. IMCC14364]
MARPVTITLSHDLGKEEARRRVEENFDKIKSAMSGGIKFRFTEEWSGDRLSFTAKGLGQNIKGDIDIFEAHVRIVAVLPSLLAGIAESISGSVEKQGQILLEKK